MPPWGIISRYRDEQAAPRGTATVEILPDVDSALTESGCWPSLHGFWLTNWLNSTPHAAIESTYQQLAKLVTDGTLRAPVEARFPLEEYREAIRRSSKFRRAGKILFRF